jgi:hypothetical protein
MRGEGRSLSEVGIYKLICERLDALEGERFPDEVPTLKVRRTPPQGMPEPEGDPFKPPTPHSPEPARVGSQSGEHHFREAGRLLEKTREVDLDEMFDDLSKSAEEKRTSTEPGLGKPKPHK